MDPCVVESEGCSVYCFQMGRLVYDRVFSRPFLHFGNCGDSMETGIFSFFLCELSVGLLCVCSLLPRIVEHMSLPSLGLIFGRSLESRQFGFPGEFNCIYLCVGLLFRCV